MQLTHQPPDSKIYVKHYRPGTIAFSDKAFSHSVIFTPDKILVEHWPVPRIDELSMESLTPIFSRSFDIILLGTGNEFRPLTAEITHAYARIGQAIDAMSSNAACSTFNLLAQEKRNVVAAVIV